MGGREVVRKLIDTLNAKNVDGMDEVFQDDAVMEWPQSGERIVSAENRRGVYHAFPNLPTITPRRMTGDDDLVVAEATLDYGDGAEYQTVFIFELRDGKIAKETAYWSQPFPAPEWRDRWVEPMDPAPSG